MEENSNEVVHECQNVCKSEKHGSNLTAALTRDSFTDSNIAAYWKWCCVRYPEAVDEYGRTLLHMAAAKGRAKLVKFLLTHRDVEIHKREKESQFSALHSSIFHGHIDCAVHLIKAGANLDQRDLDELTPLDHLSLDRPVNHRELETCAHDIYVWGSNSNNNLGVSDQKERDSPDPIEFFQRQKVFFKQVVLEKYHSAFLSRDGRLWLCGQGAGGRLGFEKEHNHVGTPRLLSLGATSAECHSVALARNHTVLVLSDKTVWSFGMNDYHQLGHDPPPEKVLVPRFVRGLRQVGIIGVSAAKYHTAFWSDTRLYTCGLNGGQLGHTRDAGVTVIVPKAVSGLRQCSIKMVTCTIGATVLANSYGEIYLFYDYICRKITSRPFYPKLFSAVGGHLNHKLNVDCLKRNGGRELEVLVVTSCNCIYIWKEGDRRYLKYELNFDHRILHIVDIVFHSYFLMLITRDGKAYLGKIIGNRSMGSELNGGSSRNYIELIRIPLIHRAVMLASDPKGHNYAITQFQPKSRLYNFPRATHAEVDIHMRNLYRVLDRTSYFQDVEFEVEGHRFAAHRYIVGHASKVLEDMMNGAVQPDGTCRVKIKNVGAQVFRALLCFIYTRDFNLISPYPTNSRKMNADKDFDEMKLPFEYNGKKYLPLKEKPISGKDRGLYMKSLEKAANMFGVHGLKEELEGRDMLFKKSKVFPTSLVKFDRERLSYLWDTTLKSEDGTEINAHKCILVSRLEYFNCMMNNKSWMESTQDMAIELPLPGEVLTILINYLYTGAAPLILKSEDLDLVFMTLIIADQLFCEGLKNICEYTLGQLMNLENAPEIFQIGLFYNAVNLKRFSLEFICQNLGYLLEKGSLEDLHDFVLAELSAYYRSRVPQMCMRRITAFCDAPDEELINLIGKTEPVCIEIEENYFRRSRRRSPKRRNKSRRYRLWFGPRSGSLDSLTSDEGVDYLKSGIIPRSGRRGKGVTLIRVVRRPQKSQKKTDREVAIGKTAAAADVKEDKYVRVKIVPLKAISMNSVTDIQSPSTSSEGNLPGLKHSSSERNIDSCPASLPSNAGASDKILKLSRKHEGKSLGESSRQDEECVNQEEAAVTSAEEESEESGSTFDSDYSRDTSSCSSETRYALENYSLESKAIAFSDDEEVGFELGWDRRRRRLPKLPKSMHQFQAEEKAIGELLALYNADLVRDQRITIRRAGGQRRRKRTANSN